MKPTYREKNLLDYLFGGFRSTLKLPPLNCPVDLEGILSEASSESSQKRRTSKKPKAKNIEKSCSYRQNENVPPDFKQYKNQGNVSNLVQSHFGSPLWKELESGIAPLVPRGFDPAFWGLIQLLPSLGFEIMKVQVIGCCLPYGWGNGKHFTELYWSVTESNLLVVLTYHP